LLLEVLCKESEHLGISIAEVVIHIDGSKHYSIVKVLDHKARIHKTSLLIMTMNNQKLAILENFDEWLQEFHERKQVMPI